MSTMTPEERWYFAISHKKGAISSIVYREIFLDAIGEAEADTRERCAKIAESGPEPVGLVPGHGIDAHTREDYERQVLVRATAQVMRENIAAKIRRPPAESEVPG